MNLNEENRKPKKRRAGRPKGTTKDKKTKSEVQQFLKEGLEKILNNHYSWSDFLRWSKEEHSLSESQANVYWVRIWSELKDRYKTEREQMLVKHIYKYWKIHDDALRKKDLNTARQVLNDIAKLMGLNEPEKVEVDNKETIIFKFGDENKE
jgi:hypothetical protein